MDKFIQKEIRYENCLKRILNKTEKLWITNPIKNNFDVIGLTYSVANKLLSELQIFHKAIEENTTMKNQFKASRIYKKMNKTVIKYQQLLNNFNFLDNGNQKV